jgi:hypothetical protein
MFLFIVFGKINMRFGNAYKSSAVSSCVCKGHDTLVTPDAFLYWGLIHVKPFILWGKGEFVKSVGKVDAVK